uniref:SEA domain-containing protein n=1 Tax=Leptobrachium leishanense TaxID=445787 RepID=A0A8C5QUD4_9ANUR
MLLPDDYTAMWRKTSRTARDLPGRSVKSSQLHSACLTRVPSRFLLWQGLLLTLCFLEFTNAQVRDFPPVYSTHSPTSLVKVRAKGSARLSHGNSVHRDWNIPYTQTPDKMQVSVWTPYRKKTVLHSPNLLSNTGSNRIKVHKSSRLSKRELDPGALEVDVFELSKPGTYNNWQSAVDDMVQKLLGHSHEHIDPPQARVQKSDAKYNSAVDTIRLNLGSFRSLIGLNRDPMSENKVAMVRSLSLETLSTPATNANLTSTAATTHSFKHGSLETVRAVEFLSEQADPALPSAKTQTLSHIVGLARTIKNELQMNSSATHNPLTNAPVTHGAAASLQSSSLSPNLSLAQTQHLAESSTNEGHLMTLASVPLKAAHNHTPHAENKPIEASSNVNGLESPTPTAMLDTKTSGINSTDVNHAKIEKAVFSTVLAISETKPELSAFPDPRSTVPTLFSWYSPRNILEKDSQKYGASVAFSSTSGFTQSAHTARPDVSSTLITSQSVTTKPKILLVTESASTQVVPATSASTSQSAPFSKDIMKFFIKTTSRPKNTSDLYLPSSNHSSTHWPTMNVSELARVIADSTNDSLYDILNVSATFTTEQMSTSPDLIDLQTPNTNNSLMFPIQQDDPTIPRTTTLVPSSRYTEREPLTRSSTSSTSIFSPSSSLVLSTREKATTSFSVTSPRDDHINVSHPTDHNRTSESLTSQMHSSGTSVTPNWETSTTSATASPDFSFNFTMEEDVSLSWLNSTLAGNLSIGFRHPKRATTTAPTITLSTRVTKSETSVVSTQKPLDRSSGRLTTLQPAVQTTTSLDTGRFVDPSQTSSTPPHMVSVPLNFRIIGILYSAQLQDKLSEEYTKLEKEVKLVLNKIYSKYRSEFLDVNIKNFLNGSVITQVDLVFGNRSPSPNGSSIVRTLLTSDLVHGNEFGWRIDTSSVESKGFTSQNLEPKSMFVGFLVLHVGFIAENSAEAQLFLEKLNKEVTRCVRILFPGSFLISRIRDLNGDLEVTGNLLLDTKVDPDMQALLRTLLPLGDVSVDLSSVVVDGYHMALQDFPFTFRVTNRLFHIDLLDMSSPMFKELSNNLSAVVKSVLKNYDPSQVIIREFRSGSIVCKGNLVYKLPAPGSGEVLRSLMGSLGSGGILGSSPYKIDMSSLSVGDSKPGPNSEYIDFPGFAVAIIVMCGLSILIFPVLAYVCIKTKILGRRQKASFNVRSDPDRQSHHFEMDNRAFHASLEHP